MEGVGERQRIVRTAFNLMLFSPQVTPRPALSLPNIHTRSILFLLLKFRRIYSTRLECLWKHEIKQNLYMWAFRTEVSLNFVSFSQLSEEIVQVTDRLPCVYFIDSATSHSPFWPRVFKSEIPLLEMQDRADLQESPRRCPNPESEVPAEAVKPLLLLFTRPLSSWHLSPRGKRAGQT